MCVRACVYITDEEAAITLALEKNTRKKIQNVWFSRFYDIRPVRWIDSGL